MSVDTTFKPIGQTFVVDNTAAATSSGDPRGKGITTFRVVARVANAYLAWGASNVGAPAVPSAVGAITLPTGAYGVIGLTVGVPCYIEVPANVFFISNAAFATSNVEITPGQGGVGG